MSHPGVHRRLAVLGAVGLLAVGASVAGCGSSALLTDGRQVLSKAVGALAKVESVHFRLDAGGNVVFGMYAPGAEPAPESASASALEAASATATTVAPEYASSAPRTSTRAAASPTPRPRRTDTPTPSPTVTPTASPTDTPSSAAMPTATPSLSAVQATLDGSWAEGDIDFAHSSAHVQGAVPGVPGLSGEVIVSGGYAWVRAPGQTRYTLEGIGNLAIDPTDRTVALWIVQQVMDVAASQGSQLRLIGMENMLGESCYHVQVPFQLETLTEKGFGVALFGSGTLDLWIARDSFRLRVMEFAGSEATAGPVSVRLQLSNINAVAPIKEPRADQFDMPSFP